jgi:hypothetical protein
VPRHLGQLEANISALGDEGNRPWTEVVPRKVELAGQVGNAQAIWSNQDNPCLAASLNGSVLNSQPLLIALAQARRDGDDGTGTRRDRIFYGLSKSRGPNGDHNQLGSLGQIAE